MPDREENWTLAPTYVSLVDLRCCYYYFLIFHGECCMKHGVRVATEIFISENQTT